MDIFPRKAFKNKELRVRFLEAFQEGCRCSGTGNFQGSGIGKSSGKLSGVEILREVSRDKKVLREVISGEVFRKVMRVQVLRWISVWGFCLQEVRIPYACIFRKQVLCGRFNILPLPAIGRGSNLCFRCVSIIVTICCVPERGPAAVASCHRERTKRWFFYWFHIKLRAIAFPKRSRGCWRQAIGRVPSVWTSNGFQQDSAVIGSKE